MCEIEQDFPMGKAQQQTALEVAGREVVITNPDKVFFPRAGHTKLDLARYYAAVAQGALRGIAARSLA
jgi:bifunctional non-homologous end joining protein LigD